MTHLPDEPTNGEQSMVEVVARAICVATGDDPDREGERLTAYDDLAIAAIEAMRPDIVKLLRTATVNMPYDLAEQLVDAALSDPNQIRKAGQG